MATKSFSLEDLAALEPTKYLYIRSGEHRFIAVWVVVVEGRVIVRSWNDKARGWYRSFLAEPLGHVKIGDREVPVRAVPLRSKRINDAADEAYGAKYTSKANAKTSSQQSAFGIQWDGVVLSERTTPPPTEGV